MATEILHAWCAGFVDAEGCIRISRSVVSVKDSRRTRPVHQVCLTVNQIDRAVLVRFQEVLECGGNLDNGRMTKGANFPVYTLKYSSETAMDALAKIKPYLRRKRRQADLIDRFVVECEIGRRGRKRVSQQMYRLRDFYFNLLKSEKR